jgi:hypothetical protein
MTPAGPGPGRPSVCHQEPCAVDAPAQMASAPGCMTPVTEPCPAGMRTFRSQSRPILLSCTVRESPRSQATKAQAGRVEVGVTNAGVVSCAHVACIAVRLVVPASLPEKLPAILPGVKSLRGTRKR